MTESARPTPAVEAESEIVRALAAAGNVQEAACDVLAALGRAFGWDVAILWVPRDDSGLLHRTASWSAPGDAFAEFCRVSERLTFARDVGLPGRAWGADGPLWVDDLGADPG